MNLIFTLSAKDKFNLFFKKATTLGGLIFFLFGMIFVIVFGSAADLSAIRFRLSPTQTTTGTVIESRGTSYSEGDRNVIKYNYKYGIQGVQHYGQSFSSTRYFSENETVKVEYLTYHPEVSRIKGMKRKPFSMWGILFVAIFPLIGLSFLTYNFIQTRQQIAIIDRSAAALGKLINARRTGTRINDRYVYKMEFEYTVHGRVYHTIARTLRPELLKDDIEEPLLYSIGQPEKAVMFDTLPTSIQEKLYQKFSHLKTR
jgi:hypothetical protein